MPSNYLELEPLLIARIKAELPDLRAVLSGADLAGMTESAQVTPAVHVLYDGDTVPTADSARGNDGVPQKVQQHWLTVVSVRNARTQRSNAAARQDAGALISQLLAALAGWQPAGTTLGALTRRQAPAPAYTPGGFAYFPIAWTTEFYT